MKKYLIILYLQYNNGTADKKAMYEYENMKTATAAFHGYLSANMKDETVEHMFVLILDTDGNPKRVESWPDPVNGEVAED